MFCAPTIHPGSGDIFLPENLSPSGSASRTFARNTLSVLRAVMLRCSGLQFERQLLQGLSSHPTVRR
eukprot:2515088-Prymnesium_polylepis.3